MATPPSNALPIIQTLAGLFGGLMQAKQQYQANPRYGFSMMPILAGGANGLATGMSGAATRAEELRQEARKTNDAYGSYAAMTHQPLADIQALFGGAAPTEFRGDVGTAIRNGMGNQALGRQMNIIPAGDNSLYSADTGVLGSLLGVGQKQLADTATTNALSQAQNAGAYDAGGNQTDNALKMPVVPSLSSLLGPQHRALANALGQEGAGTPQAIPSVKFMGQPSPSGQVPQTNVQAPPTTSLGTNPDGSTRVYLARTPDPALDVPTGTAPMITGGAQATANGVPVAQDTGVDMGLPKTLAQIAMMAKDPNSIAAMYGHASNAVNARNTQNTSMFNTAQTLKAGNERAILDYQKPTIAGIIANGSPQQQSTLMQYADAGSTKLQGTAKPPTRGEIAGAAKQIENSPNKEGRIAAAQRAVQTNTLTPEQAVAAANGGVFGSDPISLRDIQPGPAAVSAPAGTLPNIAPGNGPAVAPRLPDFMPMGNYPNIQMIQQSSMGSVNKKARENNGAPGRINHRNYGY